VISCRYFPAYSGVQRGDEFAVWPSTLAHVRRDPRYKGFTPGLTAHIVVRLFVLLRIPQPGVSVIFLRSPGSGRSPGRVRHRQLATAQGDCSQLSCA